MRPPAGRSDSCSEDLERARELSRRLKGVKKPGAPARPPEGPFTSLAISEPPAPKPRPPPAPARPAAAAAASPAPSPAPSPPPTPARAAAPAPRPPATEPPPARAPLPAPTSSYGSAAWNALLDECLDATHGESAFVMDPQGLIVAAAGRRPAEELEAIGSRLMIAFDQGDRMQDGQRSLTLTLETSQGALFGVRLLQEDGSVLTLGILSSGAMGPVPLQRIWTLLAGAGATQP